MRAFVVLLVAFLAVAAASNVKVLTPENFDQVVDGSKAAFVKFYAPWCGHCKNLEPAYEEIANAFADSAQVVVAKVNADDHKELGSRFGVRGFPTLKFFPKGFKKGDEPLAYEGGRGAEDIINYIKENANARPKRVAAAVVDLTDKNFDEIVNNPKSDVLVEFYAPWCGHCKRLTPDYEKVAQAFKNEPSVVVAKIDADNKNHKAIASKFGVSGFPTIKFFPKADKENPVDYNKGRDVESFVAFLNENAGTKRSASGALDATAGRIAELDAIAAKLAAAADKSVLVAEATKLIGGLSSELTAAGKAYARAFEKVAAEGVAYVTKEVARLQKLIDSPSTKGVKADEFKVRLNILSAFQADE